MYEESESSAMESPANTASPLTEQEGTISSSKSFPSAAKSSTTTGATSKTAVIKNASIQDILETHNLGRFLNLNQSDEESTVPSTSSPDPLNPQLVLQLSDVIQKKSVVNREAVRKGVMSFSKSTAYLSQQLSKGPLSEHDIKWLEVGLAPQQPAPIQDGFFKVGEALIEVGKVLEGIEAASERYVVAKKRREMLVEQRDKLLRIASARRTAGGVNSSFSPALTPQAVANEQK